MSDLDRRHFRRATKELDEVGTAVSVMGTSRRKLDELARLVDPMVDSLVGSRPEVKKLRDELRRALHNMRKSPTTPRKASRAIREVLSKVEDMESLVTRKKLGEVPPSLSVEGFDLVNVWGYSEKELKSFVKDLSRADKTMRDIGLGNLTVALVMLDPKSAGSDYLSYVVSSDQFVANPDKGSAGGLEGVFQALGARLWFERFRREDMEVWGRDVDRFVGAFGRKLAGSNLGRDTEARLSVTVGRHANGWSAVA